MINLSDKNQPTVTIWTLKLGGSGDHLVLLKARQLSSLHCPPATDPKFTPKSGAVIITLGRLTSRQLLSKLLETVESNLYGYLSLLRNLAWQAFYTPS